MRYRSPRMDRWTEKELNCRVKYGWMSTEQANHYRSEVGNGKVPDRADAQYWQGLKPDVQLYPKLRILMDEDLTLDQYTGLVEQLKHKTLGQLARTKSYMQCPQPVKTVSEEQTDEERTFMPLDDLSRPEASEDEYAPDYFEPECPRTPEPETLWSPPSTPIRQRVRERTTERFYNDDATADQACVRVESNAQAARKLAEWNGKHMDLPPVEKLSANQMLFMLMEIAVCFGPHDNQAIYNKAVEAMQCMTDELSWDLTGIKLPPSLALLTADVCIQNVMGPTGNFEHLHSLAQSGKPEYCYVYLRLVHLLNDAYANRAEASKCFNHLMALMECPVADFRDEGVIQHIADFPIDDVCKHLLTYYVFYLRKVEDMKKPYEIDKQCLDIYVKECQVPTITTLVLAVHKGFNVRRSPINLCRAVLENRGKFKLNTKTRDMATRLYVHCLAVLDIACPNHGFTLHQ